MTASREKRQRRRIKISESENQCFVHFSMLHIGRVEIRRETRREGWGATDSESHELEPARRGGDVGAPGGRAGMPAGLIKATANIYINFNRGISIRRLPFVHLNVHPKFSVNRDAAVSAERRRRERGARSRVSTRYTSPRNLHRWNDVSNFLLRFFSFRFSFFSVTITCNYRRSDRDQSYDSITERLLEQTR